MLVNVSMHSAWESCWSQSGSLTALNQAVPLVRVFMLVAAFAICTAFGQSNLLMWRYFWCKVQGAYVCLVLPAHITSILECDVLVWLWMTRVQVIYHSVGFSIERILHGLVGCEFKCLRASKSCIPYEIFIYDLLSDLTYPIANLIQFPVYGVSLRVVQMITKNLYQNFSFYPTSCATTTVS